MRESWKQALIFPVTDPLGGDFALTLMIEWRSAQAKQACLQPGAQIRNLGAGADHVQFAFANLEVTSPDGTAQDVKACPADISHILGSKKFPAGSSANRTVLEAAFEEASQYQQTLKKQNDEEWAVMGRNIKAFFKRFIP